MKIVKKSQAKKFKNSDKCFGLEYQHNDSKINGALITIKGRYPDMGRVVNLKCKELVYVIKGSGQLICERKAIKFSKDDIIVINPKEKFYWDGDCEILTVCIPAFYPAQHKQVK